MRLTSTTLALALLVPLPALAQDPALDPVPPPPAPVTESTEVPIAAPPAVEMPAPVEPTPPPAAPAPSAAVAEVAGAVLSGIKWEGLVDTYYMWNFNAKDPDNRTSPGLRNFDTQANSFSLNYMKLGAGLDTDLAAFRVDFGYGHTGGLINTLSGGSSSGTLVDPTVSPNEQYTSAFFVQQAFATMKLGLVTIDAGKFVTTAGSEVIEANKNWLYSRSLLFYGIPLVHTGVRVNVKPTDIVSLQLSAVNGWNNDPDISGEKTFGANVTVTPTSATTIAATTYIGKETSGADTRMLFDLVVSQVISDTIALNLNVDYLKEGDPYWVGASLMGKVGINENLYLAARGEYVMGKDGGFLAPPDMDDSLSLYEGTLMLGIPWGQNLELRVEGRGDFSDKEIFGNGDGEAKKNQFTATAAFLAYF